MLLLSFFSCYILGIVFGLKELSMDIFEKDSHLNDVENLLLPLTYDISSSLVAVFIAYYGGKGNIPRWVTFASFLVGFGSLLFAYPYFTEGAFKANVDIEGKIIKSVKLLFKYWL